LKITLFGLTISSSWGNGHATPYRAILTALKRMGHEVVFYEKDVPYYARRRDLPRPEFCELVFYSDWQAVRARARQDVSSSDVAINASYCPDGKQICDEVLDVDGPLHVFYDLDTPITLDALSREGADYIRTDQIPSFDLYLSFSGGSILDQLETKWGARAAEPLYGCVDPDVHARVPERPDLSNLMSYMGTYAADRQQKVHDLFLEAAKQKPRDTFVLAGSMYPADVQWPTNVRRLEHLSPHHHPALYSSSRFTINLTRGGMSRAGFCPSGRFFEAAACGTPLITDWFTGLDTFFTPGEEILVVSNTADVLSALDASAEDGQKLAARARERTLSEHTGDCRARQMLGYFDNARAKGAYRKMEFAR
jgi:spore maturation protein CgeB